MTVKKSPSMESRQPLITEDETFRKLAQRPFDEVYAALSVSVLHPFESNPELTKKILAEHGWTAPEFIDQLLLQLNKLK